MFKVNQEDWVQLGAVIKVSLDANLLEGKLQLMDGSVIKGVKNVVLTKVLELMGGKVIVDPGTNKVLTGAVDLTLPEVKPVDMEQYAIRMDTAEVPQDDPCSCEEGCLKCSLPDTCPDATEDKDDK